MILGKRAVSEILGALLMITITVAAFTVFYLYSVGVFGQLQGAQPQQPYVDRIALEFYDWTDSSSAHLLKMEIRNVGSSNIIIRAVYINANNVTTITWGSAPNTCPSGNLAVQASCLLQLTQPSGLNLTPGIAYSVVFSTARGGQIRLSATFGQTG
jgi:flagellin-like protein